MIDFPAGAGGAFGGPLAADAAPVVGVAVVEVAAVEEVTFFFEPPVLWATKMAMTAITARMAAPATAARRRAAARSWAWRAAAARDAAFSR
ncbi:MAG: hypothetical protein NVSMB12_10830 [Acidimicrobiales bacterium]